MIAMLIGGTVVLCIGLLTVVFGIPIKEFSFGNTMIMTGAIVSCTGLILIGLYFIGRELKNLTRRLEAGVPLPAPVVPAREVPVVTPPAPQPPREDRLFVRDELPERSEPVTRRDRDQDRAAPETAPEVTDTWPDHPVSRARNPMPAESVDAPAEPTAERPAPVRRNIMFASHRRDSKDREPSPRPEATPDEGDRPSFADSFRQTAASAADPFESAWPQQTRSRPDSSAPPRGDRFAPAEEGETAEPAARERFQPPRRSDASSVTIVKSGVVDSMAYSLYSDGSIEAQMPEGMVRFASIDELRAHLDERN